MMRTRFLAPVVVAVLLTSCGGGVPHGGARTYYETLDLSTASAAATTFVDAFSRNDFMTVWLVFDPFAQVRFVQAINLLQYAQIIDTDAIPDVRDVFAEDFRAWPHESTDVWYGFDLLMLIADRYDAFLIDLGGPATVIGEALGSDPDGAEVFVEAADIDGDLTLRMQRTPGGSWRVLQVIVPGGDQQAVIWPALEPSP